MNTEELIKLLESKGVKFSIQNQELKIHAPKGVISPEMQKELGLHKAEILRLVSVENDKSNQESITVKAEKKNVNLDFSLFFFANDESIDPNDKYRLVIEAAKFADKNGFSAIWTPERHFHELGGIFPNPSIIAAAIAMITNNIKLRAGSVVLPLNDPIRVVEAWSVVDNLSKGRAEMSFATGWHVNDFVFASDNYQKRKDIMFSEIETVKKLWHGESITRKNGAGTNIEVKTYPRPIQKELNVWVTAIGNPDTYIKAGESGANLMTCLLDQEVDELEEKLNLYKDGLRRKGFNPAEKRIAVFAHSYLGDSLEEVKKKIYKPFTNYLKGTLDLLGKFGDSTGIALKPSEMPEEEQAALLDFAFNRYFENGTLMGTIESTEKFVDSLAKAGATEIACLIDFGLSFEDIMLSLEKIKILSQKYKNN